MQTQTAPLAPRYASWPAREEEIVTVLADGPSLHESPHRAAESVCGPVVAVNRALRYSDAIPIDVWAMADDPTNLWDWSDPHRPDGLRYFTVHQNLLVWSELVQDISRLYCWPKTEMNEHPKTSNGQYALVPTIFHVLAWLLKLGTKRVRLLGCDMAGSGNPGVDWKLDEELGWRFRWGAERFFLARSMKHYRARGARIDRWVSPRKRTT
jgi:hypothetical protein